MATSFKDLDKTAFVQIGATGDNITVQKGGYPTIYIAQADVEPSVDLDKKNCIRLSENGIMPLGTLTQNCYAWCNTHTHIIIQKD